ncbi:MAG: glycosyltransferase [Holophagales bacterium]|nr:glycosyltransferase [Holophagales bacterium]
MRVLHAVHGFAPEFRGGVESYVAALASAQRARGDDAAILSGSDVGPSPVRISEEDVSGLPVFRLEGLAPHTERLRDRPDGEELVLELLRRLAPEVLHVHSWLRLVPSLAALAASAGIPTVATLHDVAISCPRVHRLKADLSFCRVPESPGLCTPCVRRDPWETDAEVEDELSLRALFLERERSILAAALVPSEAQRRLLEELGVFSPGTLEVLPVALPDHPLPATAAAARTRTSPGLDLGHWGNLLPAKGTGLLVAAVRSLPESLGVVLHLFGTASDPAFENALRASAPPGRVVFHGPYDPPDLTRFPLDAAAFPSMAHESHSFTLDEAFSLGLPLVVSDAGALPGRTGGRGLVVRAGDEQALADALRRLALEPGLLAKLRASRPGEPPMPFPEHLSRLDAVYEKAILARAPESPPLVPARTRLLALQRRASRRQADALESREAFDRLQGEASALVRARDVELQRLYDTEASLTGRVTGLDAEVAALGERLARATQDCDAERHARETTQGQLDALRSRRSVGLALRLSRFLGRG